MKLLVLKISGKTYYSHHLSKEPGRIWYKEFRSNNFIYLPIEVERLRKGDILTFNGHRGYLICEDRACFMAFLKWERGNGIEKYHSAIDEVSRCKSEAGIVYQLNSSPIARSINQNSFQIPMLNIA